LSYARVSVLSATNRRGNPRSRAVTRRQGPAGYETRSRAGPLTVPRPLSPFGGTASSLKRRLRRRRLAPGGGRAARGSPSRLGPPGLHGHATH